MKKMLWLLLACMSLMLTISCSKPANDKQSRNNEAVKAGDTSEQSASIKQEKAETPVGLRDRRPEADEAADIKQEKAETPVGLRDRHSEADKPAGVKQKTAKKEAPAPVRYAFVLRRKEQIIHITIDLANQKVLYEWGDSASKSHLPWINRYVPVSRIMNEQKAADIIKIMKQFQIKPEYGFVTEKSDLEQMQQIWSEESSDDRTPVYDRLQQIQQIWSDGSVRNFYGSKKPKEVITSLGLGEIFKAENWKDIEKTEPAKNAGSGKLPEEPVQLVTSDHGSQTVWFDIYVGTRNVFSLAGTEHGVGLLKPDTSSDKLISMDYEGMYGSDKPRDYRDYLVDLKGDGDKRYLIVTTYNGGNSAYSFEGYLLDAKDDFAFVGMIPVHEITRYPAKNPDLIFKFCEEISYFGAMGTAAVSIPMKLEKGKAPSLVIPKEKPFDLRPHQEYLKHLLGNSLKRKYAVEPAIYVLYCSLASAGKIKAAKTAAKLLGFTKQEIEEYGNACLERLRRCESYPLLVRINQGEF